MRRVLSGICIQAVFGFWGLLLQHEVNMYGLAPAQLHPHLQTLDFLPIQLQPYNRPNMFQLRTLHIRQPMPGKFFLQMSTRFNPVFSSRLCSNFTLLEKISLSFLLFSLIFLDSHFYELSHSIFLCSFFISPHQNANSVKARALLCSLMCSQSLELCLAQ